MMQQSFGMMRVMSQVVGGGQVHRGGMQSRGYAFAAVNNKQSLSHAFEERVGQWDHRDAFIQVEQKYRWTFQEYKKFVNGFSNGFLDYNYQSQMSKVATMLGSDAEGVVSMLGCNRMGVAWVPVPPTATVDRVSQILSEDNVRGFILTQKYLPFDKVITVIPEVNLRQMGAPFRSIKYPSLKHIIHTERFEQNGMTKLRYFLSYNRIPDLLPSAQEQLKASSLASVINDFGTRTTYTSEEVLNGANTIGNKLQIEVGNRVCFLSDVNSFYGQLSVWANIIGGGVLVLPYFKFDVERVLTALQKENCVAAIGTAEEFKALFSSPKFNAPSLQKVLILGAAPSADVEALIKSRGIKSIQRFSHEEVKKL